MYCDLSTFAGRSTVRTWLFAVARNRVRNAAKSRRRRQAHIEEDDAADVPDPTPPPGELLDEARLWQASIVSLRELGEYVRGVLILRYQQGFTFEELSAIFQEKPGTLQARARRALALLRICIERRTGGERPICARVWHRPSHGFAPTRRRFP